MKHLTNSPGYSKNNLLPLLTPMQLNNILKGTHKLYFITITPKLGFTDMKEILWNVADVFRMNNVNAMFTTLCCKNTKNMLDKKGNRKENRYHFSDTELKGKDKSFSRLHFHGFFITKNNDFDFSTLNKTIKNVTLWINKCEICENVHKLIEFNRNLLDMETNYSKWFFSEALGKGYNGTIKDAILTLFRKQHKNFYKQCFKDREEIDKEFKKLDIDVFDFYYYDNFLNYVNYEHKGEYLFYFNSYSATKKATEVVNVNNYNRNSNFKEYDLNLVVDHYNRNKLEYDDWTTNLKVE